MFRKILLVFLACTLTASLCALSADAVLLDRAAYADTAMSERITFTAVEGRVTPLRAASIEEKLGLKSGSLTGITITRLPAASDGTLLVGVRPARAYEQLTRAQADTLLFLPTAGRSTEFTFLPASKAGAREAIATMTVVEKLNAPPVVESAMLSTVEGIDVSADIRAHDPEGDTVSVVILERPKKGSVTFDGLSYTYKPFPGQKGEDTFRFACEDKYGNRSKEGIVKLLIERAKEAAYADMSGSPSHYAAYKLREASILGGENIGGHTFFRPQEALPRGEFLLLLLAATGRLDALAPSVDTGLVNDGDIPLWLKPYVALGVRTGLVLEDRFVWQEVPARAEAVILVRRAAGMSYVQDYTPSVSDLSTIPEWALRSYSTLDAYRMLDLYESRRAKPMELLTRDYAADLVWQLSRYHESEAAK